VTEGLAAAAAAVPWVRFRIVVGHELGVQPGNIVGAIANEAGIDSTHIGRIEIFDAYSTVDLPDGMPMDVFETLRATWVCGQKLAISAEGGRRPSQRAPQRPSQGPPTRAPKRQSKGPPKRQKKPSSTSKK
jgi:ATP-dependent RNA helicase DeaD